MQCLLWYGAQPCRYMCVSRRAGGQRLAAPSPGRVLAARWGDGHLALVTPRGAAHVLTRPSPHGGAVFWKALRPAPTRACHKPSRMNRMQDNSHAIYSDAQRTTRMLPDLPFA